jgi:hypothetical protein
MILFAENDSSRNVPFPELSSDGIDLPRGISTLGGPPIAGLMPSNLEFSVNDGSGLVTGLTDFMLGIGWLVVSKKLKDVLEACDVEAESISVSIRYKGDIHKGFYIVNPTRRVCGVDPEKSNAEYTEVGTILSADKLVIDESRFAGIPLSVLHETGHIAIQEQVAESIQRAGCVGCAFIDPVSVRL